MHDENWMMVTVMMKSERVFGGAGAGMAHQTISALGSPHFAKTDLPADLLVFVSAVEDLHQLRRLQLAGRWEIATTDMDLPVPCDPQSPPISLYVSTI